VRAIGGLGRARWYLVLRGWPAASSVALVAFGASSLLDGTASAVLVWRFRHERSGADVDAVERRAAFAVGVVMSAVALYLGVRAVNALAEQSGPETSGVGIVLTAASAAVLPLLARAKLRLAAQLKSSGSSRRWRAQPRRGCTCRSDAGESRGRYDIGLVVGRFRRRVARLDSAAR
jgi:hypothetical protein